MLDDSLFIFRLFSSVWRCPKQNSSASLVFLKFISLFTITIKLLDGRVCIFEDLFLNSQQFVSCSRCLVKAALAESFVVTHWAPVLQLPCSLRAAACPSWGVWCCLPRLPLLTSSLPASLTIPFGLFHGLSFLCSLKVPEWEIQTLHFYSFCLSLGLIISHQVHFKRLLRFLLIIGQKPPASSRSHYRLWPV